MKPTKKRPGASPGAATEHMRALYGPAKATPNVGGWQSPRLPRNWRERLPDPFSYYGARVERLGKPNPEGWAQGRCPLHDDKHESLSVHIAGERGGWRCFAGCGKGDMVSFHERLTGKPFAEAVRDLLGVHR